MHLTLICKYLISMAFRDLRLYKETFGKIYSTLRIFLYIRANPANSLFVWQAGGFRDIILTKDLRLLLHDIHSPTDGFFKKTRLYSVFKNTYKKIHETRKLQRWNSWTAFVVELSEPKLESSQTRDFVWFSTLISLFYKMHFMNRLEFSCFADFFKRFLKPVKNMFFFKSAIRRDCENLWIAWSKRLEFFC